MTLKTLFTIPEPFELSDLTLWQDEYISTLLLQAHLNPHHDNASRNHSFIENSSRWILEQIPSSTSLLDLGCGPGLYTSIFSKQIKHVTGVDFSKRSIEYAKTNDERSSYIEANYVELNLDAQFDVITMIHCEYGSLRYEDRIQLLANIKSHLKDNGTFFFDIFTPVVLDTFQPAQRWLNLDHGFYSNQPYTEIILNKVYPGNISLKQSSIIQNDETRVFRQWYQYFTLDSIQQELESVGLQIVEVYENLEGEIYNPHAETLALKVMHR